MSKTILYGILVLMLPWLAVPATASPLPIASLPGQVAAAVPAHVDEAAVAPIALQAHAQDTPWSQPLQLLASPLDQDPFVLDSAFGSGGTVTDGFGTTRNWPLPAVSTAKDGQRVIRLANGDVIVAALVPKLGQAVSPTTFNIGLARYTPSGDRVPWTAAPSTRTDADKNWLVYPNAAEGKYTSITSMQEHNGYLWITAGYSFYSDDLDAVLLKVRLDGGWVAATSVLDGLGPEEAIDLAFSTSRNELVVVSNRVGDDGYSSVVLKRYLAGQGDQAPSLDNSFGSYGANVLNMNICGSGGNQRCSTAPKRMASGPIVNGGVPMLFIAGQYQYATSEGHLFVFNLDWDGNFITSWGINGTSHTVFDSLGTRSNVLLDITLKPICGGTTPAMCTYETYLIAAAKSSWSSCGYGVAVAKLKTNGYAETAFGNNGWAGGPGDGSLSCGNLSEKSEAPARAVLDGNRLIIAGWSWWKTPLGDGNYSALLRVLDATSGAERFSSTYDTAGHTHTYFRDIISAGPGQVYAHGTITDWTWVTTSRFILDRIFGDGFQTQ
ncbi:hypothetical protein [Dokdonella sp.]|uniref:hypothetical protein n=3 Tax=Dokdonella sp. TaxID=2291710 RepID=UPI0027B8EB02|nr:hypothetical protein [Dokdonella sp.]